MRCQLTVMLLWAVSAFSPVDAQTITAIQPRTCAPGQASRLTVTGTDLNDSLRVVASSPSIGSRVVSVAATEAIVELTLPADMPTGPFGLWLANAGGPLRKQVLLADDLLPFIDNGNNHSVEAAQVVSTLSAIEGVCDAAASDFYRFTVESEQRVAFEIHAQILGSVFDPVVRLLDVHGSTLHLADDDSLGPDCRFSYHFQESGDYWLQIQDSRNTAAGAAYQVRIGDFPIVSHSFPLAVQIGQPTTLRFEGIDAKLASAVEFTEMEPLEGLRTISARTEGGKSAAWVSVLTSANPQVAKSDSLAVLNMPVGINGQLTQVQEVDSYQIQGRKGQLVRILARTKSLGSTALLRMQLFNAAGAMVAETKITEADEWSMDTTFPEDGVYRLQVTDLLTRGGPGFGYWVQVEPAGSFRVQFKADKAVREEFPIEAEHGACSLDLSVERFGYAGAVELVLAEPTSGIRILNPIIPAAATEATVYLLADSGWQADSVQVGRMIARAVDDRDKQYAVSSKALHRVKEPFVLRPPAWNDGAVLLSAANPTPAPFALEAAHGVKFARPVKSNTATLTLKRLLPEFKAGVTVLWDALPQGWSLSDKADKDAHTLTMVRAEDGISDLQEFSILVFGEHNGRGRMEEVRLPVEWFDPLQVTLEFSQPAVRGGRVSAHATVVRQGGEVHPVTLTFPGLPAGVTGPESIVLAAEQSEVDFELQTATDLALDASLMLTVHAATQYAGQDFSIDSAPTALPLIAGPQQIVVYPDEIELADPRGRQQLVVTGIYPDASHRDWTRQARISVANTAVAEVRDGVVYPVADGETHVEVEIGAIRQTVPVRVSNAETSRAIEFESEVLVALSKQGCNSGACHGSPSGKGGFRLSLRAFDLKLDELTLIREDFGRRVNTLEPEQSLLLLKPLMKVAHGGGRQMRIDDEAYQILRDWIAGGAASDPPDTPRIVELEVTPNQKQVLSLSDGGHQLAVTAHFADGSRRDVTHLVAYETSDTSVATVDGYGLVTPHRRGEIAVLVRYLEFIESVPLMFVANIEGFAWQAPVPNNYVDELVHAKLQQLQYLPAETCTDSEFLRRASLDVTGILPTIEETKAFLADTAPDKRSRFIDSLLDREEYAKFWALKWGDLLRMTSKLVGDEGVYKYHRWVEESLNTNMPYDEFAKQLLTGAGSTLANPPANFYRTAADMNECVETISQVFLGARLQCAKCHNHPFERWTQDNYYGLGAFFNRVQRRKTERPGEMFVYTSSSGDVTQPRTGEVMKPWLPQSGSIEPDGNQDLRYDFANWLIDPSNPYFARIEANRIWSHFFSRGIVDPIDDFRDSNPPSNTPLLDALAKDFVDSGYDRKHLMRVIMNSQTYQASYQTTDSNAEDLKYFSHQEPRLLSAEQLLDAINNALGLTQKFGSLPSGTRATQLPAPDVVKVDFLKVFGQPERSTVCACERANDSNLGMAIELFNGPMMHEKLREPNNRFRKMLAAGQSVEEAVREFYLASVCRPPNEVELKAAVEHCSAAPDPSAGLEDVCWALFNTDEFLFQH